MTDNEFGLAQLLGGVGSEESEEPSTSGLNSYGLGRAYGLGLARLYGQPNPAEKRIAVASKVAENSGFAKPLIYAMMGKDMAAAEDWDTKHAATVENTMGAQQKNATRKSDQEFTQKVLSDVISLSKTDAPAATHMLDTAVQAFPDNKFLKEFKGIQITGETKDGWSYYKSADGQDRAVNWTLFNQAQKETDEGKKKELMGKAVQEIGGPKAEKKGSVQHIDLGDRVKMIDEEGTATYEKKGRVPKEETSGAETGQEKAYNKLEGQYRAAVGNLEKDRAAAKAAGNMSVGDQEANYRRRAQSLIDQFEPSFQRHGMSIKQPWERSFKAATGTSTNAGANTGKTLTPDGKGGYIYQ